MNSLELPVPSACPAEDRLFAYSLGQLGEAESAELTGHVASCSQCCEAIAAATARSRSGESGAEREPERAAQPPAEDHELAAGSTIGRFFLLNRLGAGGMGVVWAAYDPQLDRKVALKFVRADAIGPASSEASRNILARFAREAKAMARVSHPNVIAVHDVGTTGEQLYIAEEFIRGMELSHWLAARTRSPQEIVGVFLQAARGLAAAHAAGIIHRDFKPANVLVGDDGRVRVVDFGLARSISEGDEESAPGNPALLPAPTLTSSLTQPGVPLGTPFYMSPEQYQGAPADARGDQFSFCVSLYEALFGEKPFPARTYYELANKVTQGQIQPIPRGNKTPVWLREVVLRGLRPDKEDRFASMPELIAALEKDPGAGVRTRIGIAGAALVGLCVFVLGLYQLRQRAQLCHGGDSLLAAVWNPQRQAQAGQAFLATRLPFAQFEWTRVEEGLSNYGRGWAAQHVEACEATRLRGEQSEEVLDLRMLCLAQHLQELKAAVELFTAADNQVVERAVQVVSALSPLNECADVETLKAPVRPPKDAETRSKVEQVRGTIAKAKALEESAKYAEGRAVAEGALSSANAIAYEPLRAEALVQLGELQERSRTDALAQKTLEEAFYSAESCRDDAVASRATLDLIDAIGWDQARPADALAWERLEKAVLARSNDRPLDSARLHRSLGSLLDAQGKYEEALVELRQARAIARQADGRDDPALSRGRSDIGLVLWHQGKQPEALAEFQRLLAAQEKSLGPDHPDVAALHNNIGIIYSEQGKPEEAEAELRRALAIKEKALGPDHPDVGINHANLGKTLVQRGRLPEAIAELHRALGIQEKSLPPNHPDLALTLTDLGVALWRQGHLDEALVALRRALAIELATLGPEHDVVADAYGNIANILSEQGKNDEALAEFRRVAAIHEKALGPDHPRVANDYSNLGSILNTENRTEEAMVELGRALTIQEKILGPDHPDTAMTEGNIGELDLKRRLYKKAVEHLGHAVFILEAKAPDPMVLGEFHFYLAQAHWAAKDDRGRAVALAETARSDYSKLPARHKEIAEIDAWLAGHRRSPSR